MRAAFGIARVVLTALYPLLVWVAIRHGAVRAVGLCTMAVACVHMAGAIRGAQGEHLRALVATPIALLGIGAASAILQDARFVLALPVLVNAVLCVHFTTSLAGTPVVERFARMIDGDLTDDQVRYCRTVTKVWSAYFVVNGAVAAYLAWQHWLDAWAIHAGVVGYVGMGVVGGVEYLVRKARFRKFSDHLFDRWLSRILPVPPEERST